MVFLLLAALLLALGFEFVTASTTPPMPLRRSSTPVTATEMLLVDPRHARRSTSSACHDGRWLRCCAPRDDPLLRRSRRAFDRSSSGAQQECWPLWESNP